MLVCLLWRCDEAYADKCVALQDAHRAWFEIHGVLQIHGEADESGTDREDACVYPAGLGVYHIFFNAWFESEVVSLFMFYLWVFNNGGLWFVVRVEQITHKQYSLHINSV